MTGHSTTLKIAATIAAVAAAAVPAVPANAKVFDKQHFHDSFVSDPYDCDGIPAVDSGEVDVHFTAITITEDASGISRYYDQFGRFVLNDPGSLRFTFDLDYHGTPGDPDDDTEVPNSFRIVHGPTGNSDFSGRDFCADLRQFTTP